MSLDSTIVGLSGIKADVDTNNNLKTNLPTINTQAGFTQNTYTRDATTARNMRITEEGEAYGASARLLFYSDMNGTTLLNNQWNTTSTTLTAGLINGFLRLNNSAVTTLNTGVAVTTARAFTIEDGQTLRIKEKIRHAQGSLPNKQFEFGIGMYIVAAGQSGANVEFVGFRWTLAGALLGVLEYSTGGAVTPQTVSLNEGVPFSDNVTRTYELIITTNLVEFWVNGKYLAQIPLQPDAPCILRGGAYPVINRLWFTTAPTLAPLFDIGETSVIKLGPEADTPISYRQSMMGRHSAYPQSGVTNTNGNSAVAVVNGAAITATVGTNAVAASTGLGGYYACTCTNMGIALNNTIMNTFQNPAYTIVQGAAAHGRNLIITDIRISPMIVTTALTGGGAIVNWWIAVGNTAVSQATTDAAGSTTLGSKSPRIIPLGVIDIITAAQAAGTVCARTGDSYYALETPLVVHPGEFISVGTKTLQATAAISAGVLTGAIGYGGYWE